MKIDTTQLSHQEPVAGLIGSAETVIPDDAVIDVVKIGDADSLGAKLAKRVEQGVKGGNRELCLAVGSLEGRRASLKGIRQRELLGCIGSAGGRTVGNGVLIAVEANRGVDGVSASSQCKAEVEVDAVAVRHRHQVIQLNG